MIMRVVREFTYRDARRRECVAKPGQLLDVSNRHELRILMEQGRVCHANRSFSDTQTFLESAAPFERALRVGCWLRHSASYSGGRLHVYQYAHCLASAGAKIFFITTTPPRWRKDYPETENIQFIIEGKQPYPRDLDIIMTDSKGPLGMKALAYKQDNPWVRFVCLNFETANWAAKYVPSIAANMNKTHRAAGYKNADLLLANSKISLKYLMEWMKETHASRRYGVLPPAINTYQTDAGIPLPAAIRRPYAVWCGRGTKYKNARLAAEAIWELPTQFDLVTFGEPTFTLHQTDQHRMHKLKNFPDAVKYEVYRHARCVLAPSLFEGFGMVPGEALAVGTETIVYDLPVLRWAYGDRLIYVPWNKPKAYKATVKKVAMSEKMDHSKEALWVRETYGMAAMGGTIERLPWHAVKRKSVTACMICYDSPSAPIAIEAVYPHVDKIAIAFGRVSKYPERPGTQALLEKLSAIPDPDKKIILRSQDEWTNKLEMRRWCAEQIEGNYQLILDADEIWTGLAEWLAGEIPFGCPRWVNLWHSLEHWIHDAGDEGRRWGSALPGGGSVCPHYRWSWWRPSYHWQKHFAPTDLEKNPLHSLARNRQSAIQVPEARIYHLGHALSRPMMRAKHLFYKKRDGAMEKRQRAWEKWNGRLGNCGDGIIEQIDWELPDIVKRALEAIHG